MKRKLDRSEVLKFQRDTQGMTNSQKFEYIGMSESERKQYIKEFRSQIAKSKEREINPKDINQKDMHTKIIKQGQISVHA